MISIKSHLVKMTVAVAVVVLLLAVANPVDAGSYWGFCKKVCEKHRTTDSAYTLNCDNYPEDADCRDHCFFCRDDICDNYNKVYRCPENPDRKAEKQAGLFAFGAIIIIVLIVIVVIICIVGITCCVYFAMRSRRGPTGVGVGGMAVAPAYQSMYYPTTMSASRGQSMPSQQQYETSSSA